MGSQTSFAGLDAHEARRKVDEVLRHAEFERRMGSDTTDVAALEMALLDAVSELEELKGLREKVEELQSELEDSVSKDDHEDVKDELDGARSKLEAAKEELADLRKELDCLQSPGLREAGGECLRVLDGHDECAECRIAAAQRGVATDNDEPPVSSVSQTSAAMQAMQRERDMALEDADSANREVETLRAVVADLRAQLDAANAASEPAQRPVRRRGAAPAGATTLDEVLAAANAAGGT
jgi:polyhydroxyalkanoate synthesis regulator phasin